MADDSRAVEVEFVGFTGKKDKAEHQLAPGAYPYFGGMWAVGDKRTGPYSYAAQFAALHNDTRHKDTPAIVIHEIETAEQKAADKAAKAKAKAAADAANTTPATPATTDKEQGS